MRSKSLVGLLVVGCLALASNADAALNAYLTLHGKTQGDIKGSVTQKGREGQIMVIALEQAANRPAAGGGKATYEKLQITKEIDQSSPKLHQAFANSETLDKFELRFWRPSPSGTEQQYYTAKLTNARIVGLRTVMPNNKNPDLMKYETYEEVSFSYEKIEWSFGEAGSPSSSWSESAQ